MTRFERRQVRLAAAAAALGCVCVALTAHYVRLEMAAFEQLSTGDYTPRIELAMLGAFLGFAFSFAVALTLRARLTPAVTRVSTAPCACRARGAARSWVRCSGGR